MMKMKQRLTVNKLLMVIIVLLLVNVMIYFVTKQTSSYWTGNVISPEFSKSARTKQYKNELCIRMTKYSTDPVEIDHQSFSYEFQYMITGEGQALLFRDNEKSHTLFHRYYSINDHCLLTFKTPEKYSINNIALMCLQ